MQPVDGACFPLLDKLPPGPCARLADPALLAPGCAVALEAERPVIAGLAPRPRPIGCAGAGVLAELLGPHRSWLTAIA